MNTEDYNLIKEIDKQFTETPFYGSRKIKAHLSRKGYRVNRKKIQRLMREMGIEAIYPKPNLSRRNDDHKIYPYLLKNMDICRPNQVWACDITYIPTPMGHMYLVGIIDWYSRKIVSWRLSTTLDTGFCLEVLEEALAMGKPEIFNTDQGSQFTSREFTERLENAGIKISMDSKGRALDNIIIERFWRNLKYEKIYLNEYTSIINLRKDICDYMDLYNNRRPHQALAYRYPSEVYGGQTHIEANNKRRLGAVGVAPAA